MTWEAWITLATVLLVLVALAKNLAGPDIILTGGMVVLMTAGLFSDRLPSAGQMAAFFGNDGLLTVGVLFVVAAGLTETGGMNIVSEPLLGRPRSLRDAQLRMMLPVAGISALLNNTPVVAMFKPIVQDWSRSAGLPASKLFIPLSYAAVLGGCCTLIGTSTNLVVQAMMIAAQRTDPTMPTFSMFTLAPVGLPLAVIGLGYIVLVSSRLLPDRQSAVAGMEDTRQYTVEMMVEPKSAVDGQTIEAAGLRHLPGVYLSSIERDGSALVAVGPETRLQGNDRLIFVGVVESVVDLRNVRGLVTATNQVFKLSAPEYRRCMVEAVVSDTCPLVGRSIREGRFRNRYNAAVIAVHRNGERIAGKVGDIVLRPGDTLLLESDPKFVRQNRNNRDFFLMSAVEGSQPRRYRKAWLSLSVLIAMVLVVSFEEQTGISVLHGSLIAAGLMIVTRCCTGEQARRSVDWPILIAIGSALGIGRAMETSGLAGAMAGQLTGRVDATDPWLALAAIYLLTLVFTELVTNNAAAALAFPIAHATATQLQVDFMPFAIAVAIAASAGFATPFGYQTHLMVYGPGGYRFSDFVRIGLPLDILCMIVTVALAPLFFPF
jgi:di/tricarboxylate transporter